MSIQKKSQSKNGVLSYCNHSKLFQLMYNNLCFEFYEWELETFKEHISTLDIVYWEKQLQCIATHRKIPISVGSKHFIILISKSELVELKKLLNSMSDDVHLLHINDIEYSMLQN